MFNILSLLLVYRNTIDFCLLIMYSTILLNSLIHIKWVILLSYFQSISGNKYECSGSETGNYLLIEYFGVNFSYPFFLRGWPGINQMSSACTGLVCFMGEEPQNYESWSLYMTAWIPTPLPLKRKGDEKERRERVSLQGNMGTHLSKVYESL